MLYFIIQNDVQKYDVLHNMNNTKCTTKQHAGKYVNQLWHHFTYFPRLKINNPPLREKAYAWMTSSRFG